MAKKKSSKNKANEKKIKLPYENYIIGLFLTFSLVIGAYLRSWSLQYGIMMSYDTYYFLREASYYVTGGLPKIDPMAPTVVRYFLEEDVQGVPILTSFISKITGIDLLQVHMGLPIVLGLISSVITFFIVLFVWKNKYLAVISAFFLAIMPAFIYRTTGGFMEKDTLGAPFFLICLLLAVLIIREKNIKFMAIYGVLSVLSIYLYANSYGNFFFIPILIGIYVILQPLVAIEEKKKALNLKDKLMGDLSTWILLLSGIIGLTLSLVLLPPYQNDPLRIELSLMGLGFGALMHLTRAFVKNKTYYLGALVAWSAILLAAAYFILGYNIISFLLLSDVHGISGQGQAMTFIDVIDKFYIFPILAVIGVLYSLYQIKNKTSPNENLFFLGSFLFTAFMAYQMLRNAFFFAIPLAIFAALGVIGIYDFSQKYLDSKKALALTTIIFIAFSGISVYNSNDYKTSLVPHLTDNWLTALLWLDNNTPQDEVVCNWWDYGYWIQTVGNRSTISDGMRTGMGPWISGYSELLASTDSTALQRLISMEEAAYKQSGNRFTMKHVIVDQSLLIKTGVLNSVIQRNVFSTAYFYFKGTSRNGATTTYVYESGDTRLYLVTDDKVTYCYIEQGNQRYGVSNFVVENPQGKNFVYENIQYDLQSITQIIYLNPQNAIMIPPTLKDTLFARLIIYETELKNFELEYDNGYVKIYKILR
ncbi:MAG: Oligosaccharyl transferase STT3 subunit [Candidatus Methanofastidiosum methylothiophilum]|uniref:dolichyl-phosphooligosaccharide-protein glycotransferase n=1 Tax=Candidatus Methanofastidiosum methylothiophilum TaxID=1705564 RepID=A0A150J886_9EURY|nr:MAG: Oligosaccharyl transferase STT3 subunit [Candidatus Methanofastidiosum methylthiophilus]